MKARAYLLAAGAGTRAGGPKAWLQLEGKSLLELQLAFLTSRFEPDDIAVTIQPGWRERCEALGSGVHFIEEDPASSALAALQALLRACPIKRWAFLHHVDMPVWSNDIFEALSQKAEASKNADAVLPVHHGHKGHPVVLSARIQGALLDLDPASDRLDRFLRGRVVETVEVTSARILENWNEGPR